MFPSGSSPRNACGSPAASAEAPRLLASNPANVELIVGPYRTGKTIGLLGQVIEFCRAHPFAESIILVPSLRYQKLLEQRLRDALINRARINQELTDPVDTQSGTGIIGLKIINFQRLCEIVLRRSGTAFKVVPEHVRPAIIANCMNRLKESGQLVHIAGMVDFTGTHQAALDLIDEFERAALNPDDVIRRLEKTAQADSRYMELAGIYSMYRSELASLGFYDQKGLAFKAREILYGDHFSWTPDLVCVDGFDRFNNLQLQVLAGLSRYCGTLKICFDYVSPEVDKAQEYVWKEASYKDLVGAWSAGAPPAPESHTEITNITSVEDPEGAGILPASRGSREVIKFRTIDREFEMEHIARLIKNGIVNEGRKPGDYLVVARNVRAYRSSIANAFQSAGLHYFIDEAVPLSSLPLVQFVTSLLNLANASFPRRDVLFCLNNPYFNRAEFGLARSRFGPVGASFPGCEYSHWTLSVGRRLAAKRRICTTRGSSAGSVSLV